MDLRVAKKELAYALIQRATDVCVCVSVFVWVWGQGERIKLDMRVPFVVFITTIFTLRLILSGQAYKGSEACL